jgi:hypothetical protein
MSEDEEKIRLDLDVINQRIKMVCGSAPDSLLCCYQCGHHPVRVRTDRKYNWARNLYCGCGCEWVVCSVCTTTRTPMTTDNAMQRHNKRCKRSEGQGSPLPKKIKLTKTLFNSQSMIAEKDGAVFFRACRKEGREHYERSLFRWI